MYCEYRLMAIKAFMENKRVSRDVAISYLEACHWGLFTAEDMYEEDKAAKASGIL